MESVVFPATLEELAMVDQYIRRHLPDDFGPLADRIMLAVEELLVNICRYAYEGRPGRAEINCRLVNFDGRPHFRLLLRDWGPPYDPFDQAPPPDLESRLEDRPIGGLGLHLVRSLVSHYCYSYDESANAIELFFSRPSGD